MATVRVPVAYEVARLGQGRSVHDDNGGGERGRRSHPEGASVRPFRAMAGLWSAVAGGKRRKKMLKKKNRVFSGAKTPERLIKKTLLIITSN
jgi:hypothetical protein